MGTNPEVDDNSISQAYYNHIFASSGGAEWQYPWTDKDDFQNYWKGSKCDMSPIDWQFFYERGNGAEIKHNFLPVWSYETTPLQ